MKIIPFIFTLILLEMSGFSSLTLAQTSNSKTDDNAPTTLPLAPNNWQLKTLGGMQFWTDLKNLSGWRIQQNSETGHFRLINPADVRFAFGSRDNCDDALDKILSEEKTLSPKGRIVILLHGLMRTHVSMAPLGKYLKANGNYEIVNFQYASTRKHVENHANALRQIINNLGPEVTEINFVGHSLGNIVVRRYLGDQAATNQPLDKRLNRMVMLGPPNQGSRMARMLKSSVSFKVIAGASGAELSSDWRKLEPTLATPEFEFGIIAGGQTDPTRLNNVFLSGKDDFTVSVEETKLIGATDFLTKPLIHSTMMKDKEVLKDTFKFLENGHFKSESVRNPLTSLK